MESGLLCRTARFDLGHHAGVRRLDHHFPQSLTPPAAGRIGRTRHRIEGQRPVTAFDFEGDACAFAAHDVPDDAPVHPVESVDLVAVNLFDHVAGTQALWHGRIVARGVGRRGIRDDVTDFERGFSLTDRPADRPDDHRENKSQPEREHRPSERDDDFIQRRNDGQSSAVRRRFTLDGVHRSHLRQLHKPAKRDRPQAVNHAVVRSFPDRLAEPDRKLFDHQSAPACSEKMAQFVDDDQQVKDEDDFEDDNQEVQDGTGNLH